MQPGNRPLILRQGGQPSQSVWPGGPAGPAGPGGAPPHYGLPSMGQNSVSVGNPGGSVEMGTASAVQQRQAPYQQSNQPVSGSSIMNQLYERQQSQVQKATGRRKEDANQVEKPKAGAGLLNSGGFPASQTLGPLADLEPSGGQSPGSLASSITTLDCVRNLEPGGVNKHTTALVDDALAQVNHRIDDVVDAFQHQLQSESSQLRREDESQRQVLADVSKAMDSLGTQVEALEAKLLEETNARIELEKSFNRELRDNIMLELERVRDTVMREMRERMDGQKVLREEVQLQQGTLMRLTSRVDESLVELRTELPRLGLEISTHKTSLDKVAEMQAVHVERLDATARSLSEEIEARQDGEKAVGVETRACLSRETEQLAVQLGDLRKLLEEQQSRIDTTHADLKAARGFVEQLAQDTRAHNSSMELISKQLTEKCSLSEFEAKQETVVRLDQQLRAAQERNDHDRVEFDHRLTSVDSELRSLLDTQFGLYETNMQSWVEKEVVVRVNALDKQFRKEMTDRSSTNQQILDKITHNSERWVQTQAKFDELLVEFHRAPSVSGGSHVSVGAASERSAGFGIGAPSSSSNTRH